MAIGIFQSAEIANFGGIFLQLCTCFVWGATDSDKVSVYLFIHVENMLFHEGCNGICFLSIIPRPIGILKTLFSRRFLNIPASVKTAHASLNLRPHQLLISTKSITAPVEEVVLGYGINLIYVI